MTENRPGLSYLSFASPIGWILIAGSDRGLCALHLCGPELPSEEEVSTHLGHLYPGLSVESQIPPRQLRMVMDAVLRYLLARVPLPSIPLDLTTGTPFQRDVWAALCRIPFGDTRSYQDIAQSVGRPQAMRAVGQACGRNPIALVVPCHRVISKNGKLGGFGAGLHIKQALLDLERSAKSSASAVR